MPDQRRSITDVVGHVIDYTEHGEIGTEANARALTNEIVGALADAGWKQDAANFPPVVPVDDAVVALIRLPVGITPLHEIATLLDRHLGPDLVIRLVTGIQGWVVISRPEHPNGSTK